MVRRALLFTLALLAGSYADAQPKNCTASNIYGLWKECGEIRSPTYDHPPARFNVDSLKSAFPGHDNAGRRALRFNEDGTYLFTFGTANDQSKGRFWVIEKKCALKTTQRRRNPIRIVHLEDSCLILWYNNPKWAYLTVYRR